MAIMQEEHLERCGSLSAYKQGGTFKEPNTNNPEVKVNFPISFPTACNAVLAENSFTGDARFFGASTTNVNQDSFQYISASYGGNDVRFIAFGV